jgi:cytoskeletal protein RodZ
LSNDFNADSRSGNRAKRKKTNLVLNSLIVLIMALIIFVAFTIFASGDNDKATSPKESPKTEEKQTVAKEQKDTKKVEEVKKNDGSSDDTTKEDQQSKEDSTPEKADESQAVISEGGSTSNVIKSTENPAWKAVGTTQTGAHTPVYSGVDWDEMLNAITYATGLEQSNMTVYWLGRDKSAPNASIGTVSSKDKQQKFNVYIQWVDGEGWKPTKVEELVEIQR